MLSVLQNIRQCSASYQPGSTVLTFEEELSMSPDPPGTMQALLWRSGDTEGSSNSEESHATGDSGRYSHDETEMTNLSSGPSSRPPSAMAEESGSSAEESGEEGPSGLKLPEQSCCHQEAQSGSQPAQACGRVAECV